jgi:hypothetical protein
VYIFYSTRPLSLSRQLILSILLKHHRLRLTSGGIPLATCEWILHTLRDKLACRTFSDLSKLLSYEQNRTPKQLSIYRQARKMLFIVALYRRGECKPLVRQTIICVYYRLTLDVFSASQPLPRITACPSCVRHQVVIVEIDTKRWQHTSILTIERSYNQQRRYLQKNGEGNC